MNQNDKSKRNKAKCAVRNGCAKPTDLRPLPPKPNPTDLRDNEKSVILGGRTSGLYSELNTLPKLSPHQFSLGPVYLSRCQNWFYGKNVDGGQFQFMDCCIVMLFGSLEPKSITIHFQIPYPFLCCCQ